MDSKRSERMMQDDADDDESGRQKESDSGSDQDQDSGSDSESSGEESDASEADILVGLQDEVEANEQDDGSDEEKDDEEEEEEYRFLTPAASRAEVLMDKLKHWPEDEDVLVIRRNILPYFVVEIDPFCMSLRGNAVIKKIFLEMDQRFFLNSDIDLHGCFVKLGNVFGSLEALTELHFCGSVDLSVITPIVQRTRQIRSFHFRTEFSLKCKRKFDARRFANALFLHPVQEIEMDFFTPDEIGIIINVLPTLPNLQKVTLECFNLYGARLHPKALSQLLSVGTLREALLEGFEFTELGLQAISGCLSSGSLVSKLSFVNCSFPETGGAALAASLGQNAALEKLQIAYWVLDLSFFSALKNSLPANRTLTDLCMDSVRSRSGTTRILIPDSCLVMALEGLGDNQSLRSFNIGRWPLTTTVSDAWRDCLEKNSGLKNLVMESLHNLNESYDESWRRILPFLRVNSTLESLTIDFHLTRAILPETAEALQENSSLQRLIIDSDGFSRVDLIEFVGLLTKNTTLKHLHLGDLYYDDWTFDEKEALPALLAAVRGNYGLESFNATISDPDGRCLLECIQRLNKAGRRYLIEDPASIEKGVMVLDGVKDDLNCLFLHLQENPTLCDCRKVVMLQPVSGRKRKAPESIEAAK